MAKVEAKNKQNPKLVQTVLKDGRASLALEYYLGRSESPVVDDEGNQVFYTSGAMMGKPKYKIKHNRKRENLNLYIWVHPRTQQERTPFPSPFISSGIFLPPKKSSTTRAMSSTSDIPNPPIKSNRFISHYYLRLLYSSSATGSSHSLEAFSPGISKARWANQLSAAAPCQCFTLAGIWITVPGNISCAGFPSS